MLAECLKAVVKTFLANKAMRSSPYCFRVPCSPLPMSAEIATQVLVKGSLQSVKV